MATATTVPAGAEIRKAATSEPAMSLLEAAACARRACELSQMSDEALSEMGLERQDIVARAFGFDGRTR